MSEIFKKIEASFVAAIKGQETTQSLMRWWGIVGYLFFYFIVNKIIFISDKRFVDVSLSWLGMVYFAWHIFVLKKCEPKKPKLSKEERAKLRSDRLRNIPKALMRKLLLQESISKWNPVLMSIVVDLLFVTHFLGYILR